MTESAENSGENQRGRPFQPGHSGNPAGKPRGARNRVLLALDAIGEEHAPAILETVVEAAKGGDVRAAETILSRIWPARKGRAVPAIDLPDIATPADLVTALGIVAKAVGDGDLSPDEAQAVAAVLETQRRAVETLELERRIAALEQAKENRR